MSFRKSRTPFFLASVWFPMLMKHILNGGSGAITIQLLFQPNNITKGKTFRLHVANVLGPALQHQNYYPQWRVHPPPTCGPQDLPQDIGLEDDKCKHADYEDFTRMAPCILGRAPDITWANGTKENRRWRCCPMSRFVTSEVGSHLNVRKTTARGIFD